jgi:hypothetical protein
MSWRIYLLETSQKGRVDEILQDDVLWRQTRLYRDAATLGGPAGRMYLYLEGPEEAMKRADSLLLPTVSPLTPDRAEALHARFKEEEEQSAQGMGLMFSD